MTTTKTWPEPETHSRIEMGNLYLASIYKAVMAIPDDLFSEILEDFNTASSAEVVLIATGLTMQQAENMQEKLRILRSLKDLRKLMGPRTFSG